MFDEDDEPWSDVDEEAICQHCHSLLLDPEDYETCEECGSVLCPDCQILGMDRDDNLVTLCARCARQE